MMNCRMILLQDGTMILGETEALDIDYSAYTFEIFNPVKVEPFQMQQGNMVYESYVMKAWLPMMIGNSCHIQTAKIITCIEMNEKYVEQYKMYVQARELVTRDATPAEFDTYSNHDSLLKSLKQQEGEEEVIDDNDDIPSDEDMFYDPRSTTGKRTLH